MNCSTNPADSESLDRQIADHYDELDWWYRAVWGEHVHHGLWRTGNESRVEAVTALVTYLAEQLVIEPGERVCDVGCGYGGTARILASTYRARVDGFTLSEKQFAIAQERLNGKSNPKYHLQNWMENSLDNACCDVVIGIESSEHFEDKGAMIREIQRVLKPGGRFGMYTWVANGAGAEDVQLLEAICVAGRFPNLGDESDYRQWLGDAGFTNFSYENLTGQVRKTMPSIVIRMLRRLAWNWFAWPKAMTRRNLELGQMLLRIRKAYRIGALQYGLFVAHKPTTSSSSATVSVAGESDPG